MRATLPPPPSVAQPRSRRINVNHSKGQCQTVLSSNLQGKFLVRNLDDWADQADVRNGMPADSYPSPSRSRQANSVGEAIRSRANFFCLHSPALNWHQAIVPFTRDLPHTLNVPCTVPWVIAVEPWAAVT